MDSYKTEDEQLEAIKRWMRDNGRSVVTLVLIVALAATGIYSWRQHQQREQENSSAQYQNLLDAMRQLDQQQQPNEEVLTTARHLADTIKKDYEKTTYAQFAALFKAKLAAQAGDLAQAETELRWALEHKPAADIAAVVKLRLARVLFAKGEHDAALAQLDDTQAGSYAFAYAHLRGDIKLARGDSAGARADYEKAQELSSKLKGEFQDPLLEIKLRDVQPANAAAPQNVPAAPTTKAES